MPDRVDNGSVDIDREVTPGTPLWRDPLSLGFRAHRQVLLLKLRWHERREFPSAER